MKMMMRGNWKLMIVLPFLLTGGRTHAGGLEDAPELLDRVRIPTPAGYVQLEKGTPLRDFLDKAEAADTANVAVGAARALCKRKKG